MNIFASSLKENPIKQLIEAIITQSPQTISVDNQEGVRVKPIIVLTNNGSTTLKTL